MGDVVGQVRIGSLAPGVQGARFNVAIDGHTMRYNLTYLIERLHAPTFHIP